MLYVTRSKQPETVEAFSSKDIIERIDQKRGMPHPVLQSLWIDGAIKLAERRSGRELYVWTSRGESWIPETSDWVISVNREGWVDAGNRSWFDAIFASTEEESSLEGSYDFLIGSLERPIDEVGTSSEDSQEVFDPLRLEAAEAIRDLIRHNRNQALVIEGKLGETNLTKFGPGDDGWEMELKDGPVGLIAEHLAQIMLPAGQEPLNFIEMDVIHREHGKFTFTLQRTRGKTPAQLKVEAQANTDRRDAFIVKKGLWEEFVASLG